MSGNAEKKLLDLGIVLPVPPAAIANYVGHVRSGNLLFVAGQLCLVDGIPVAKGKLDAEVTLEAGAAAARVCAINVLVQVKLAVGDLDRVTRVVRLGGFISSAPGFLDGSKVLNSASDLMVQVFGDMGRHTRTATGVSVIPTDATVEVEATFEVDVTAPERWK